MMACETKCGKPGILVESGDSLVELARKLENEVVRCAKEGASFDSVERLTWEHVLEIGRSVLDQFIRNQGDGDLGKTVTTSDDQTLLYRSEGSVTREIRSVFGLHEVESFNYSEGSHQKVVLRPVDARMSLPETKASYLFEEFSQLFCVDKAFGSAHSAIETVFKQKASVDSLERTNQRLGEQAEQFLQTLPTPPADQEAKLLVVSADCKGVPLVKEDASQIPAVGEKPERPGNRRMATLGCVYTVDPHVRSPEQIVAALFKDEQDSPQETRPVPKFKYLKGCFSAPSQDDPTVTITGPIATMTWIKEQVDARRKPGQLVIRIMDGQPTLWEAADVCLHEIPVAERVDILDILHVSSYVWRAARAFHTKKEEREAFARDRLLRILQGDGKGVILGLRRMATTHDLKGTAAKEVTTACHYFENNLDRMKYDQYLAAGYPIATGVIEGACRHLVKDRMERSGMRWTLAGAVAMLNVRAAYHSTSWRAFHEARCNEEQKHLHPHKDLLKNYTPPPLTF
jgi:hypothetical protein